MSKMRRVSSKRSSQPFPVLPRSYCVFIKPYVNGSTFDGSVIIHLDIIKETKLMLMSAKNIKVKKANLRVSSSVIKPPVITTYIDKELIVLEFGTVLKFGWAVLSIHYTGLINNSVLGLFKSCPNNVVLNKTSLSARNLFPCWDNPAIKATFEITICSSFRAALSNMPVESNEDQGEENLVKFFPTLPISVDQVSICLGNFSYIEAALSNVVIRVYTEPYKMELGRFTLDCLMRSVQHFSFYFDMNFPLPKIDAVILDDIVYDYLESWGLLVLPSRVALMKSHQSLNKKKMILKAISECIAKQWIGNLVTIDNVESLSFFTGCANYVALKVQNISHPETNALLWFLIDVKDAALACHTRMSLEGSTSWQDDTLIGKVSSILFMIDYFMGIEGFKQGIKFFVQKHKYSGTNVEQLWSSLEVYSKMKLLDTMNDWIYNDNYPLIVVKNIKSDGLDRIVELVQEPFHRNIPGDTIWAIPLTFVKSKQPQKVFFQTVMNKKEFKIRLSNIGKTGWVKINFKSIGFYRVLYPKSILQEFISDFLLKTISVDDRIGILADLRAMVLSGREKTSTLLSFISQLGDEDPPVWFMILKFFEDLFVIMKKTNAEHGFKEYALTVFKKIYNNLGWNVRKKEDPLETILRTSILKMYCHFEDSDALIEAKKRFIGLVDQNEDIDDDLLIPVYYGCARIGGEKEYSQLICIYSESMESDREKIIEGMCGFQDDGFIKSLVDFLVTDKSRPHSLFRNFEILIQNDYGAKLVWDYIKSNWDKIEAKYGDNMCFLSSLITKLLFCWPCEESEMLDLAYRIGAALPSAVEDGIGKFKMYKEWLQRDSVNIEKFFSPWASSVSN